MAVGDRAAHGGLAVRRGRHGDARIDELPRRLLEEQAGGLAARVADDLAAVGAGRVSDHRQHGVVHDAGVVIHAVGDAGRIAGGAQPVARRTLAAPAGFVPAVRAQPAAGGDRACSAGDHGLDVRARTGGGEVDLRQAERPERQVQVRVDDAGQRDGPGRERDDGHARARGRVDRGDRAVRKVDASRARVRGIGGPERTLEPDVRGKWVGGRGHRGTYPRKR